MTLKSRTLRAKRKTRLRSVGVTRKLVLEDFHEFGDLM
jgi:hypothetical protein